jgi:hypothetical protein
MEIAIVLVFWMLAAAPVCGYWRAMLVLSYLVEERIERPRGFSGDRMKKAG